MNEPQRENEVRNTALDEAINVVCEKWRKGAGLMRIVQGLIGLKYTSVAESVDQQPTNRPETRADARSTGVDGDKPLGDEFAEFLSENFADLCIRPADSDGAYLNEQGAARLTSWADQAGILDDEIPDAQQPLEYSVVDASARVCLAFNSGDDTVAFFDEDAMRKSSDLQAKTMIALLDYDRQQRSGDAGSQPSGDAGELPDAVRVPLDSLHTDAGVAASPWYGWLERRFGSNVAARIVRETIAAHRCGAGEQK